MNVTAVLPRARKHLGGASLATLGVLHHFWKTGHNCRVLTGKTPKPKHRSIRGYRLKKGGKPQPGEIFVGCPSLMQILPTERLRVAYVHSDVDGEWTIKPDTPADLVVYASIGLQAWAEEQGRTPPAPSIVVWPPLDPNQLRTTPGEHVTLVNMMPEKGADLFYSLARRMPDVPFLAVLGGWGKKRQDVPDNLPSNVRVLPYQTDPREVYSRTRIVLYPRVRPNAGPMRGLGLIPMEAAVSGIPSVVNDGPGPREALGDAAWWIEGHDLDEWESAIRTVLKDWSQWSAKASQVQVNHPDQLSALESVLRAMVKE